MFQGSGFKAFQTLLQQHFNKVKTLKPEASRSESREVYLLAQGFKVV
jgi:23S rRNA (uridine2552-2'-O)-methyltransferase